MTARELAEKIITGLEHTPPQTAWDWLESLLSVALAEAHLQGVQRTLCCCEVKKDCDCKKEARAEAFEEAARIADENNGELHDLFEPCECAMKIRRRAGEGK